MKTPIPPPIDSKFICIINRDESILAALILSYIDQSKGYIPTFEFPFVSSENFENNLDEDLEDEHQLSRTRARKFNIKVGNEIAKLGGCEYLIIAGLTDKQQSYLTFLDKCNVINIEDKNDVDVFLNGIVTKNGCLPSRESSLINNLPYALNKNLYLSVDENIGDKIYSNEDKYGLVVIEKNKKVSSVFGILYAHCIGANVELISSPKLNNYEIKNLIESWKNKEPNAYNNLSAAIFPYIEHIEFSKREFVTFFTNGVPYSLILKNIVPISHVHLRINPDFFIFNSIYFETNLDPYSAIVFSPNEFEDEETDFVIDKLVVNKLSVKPLVGKQATFYNLDNHIQHYPYSLLHLCSHGGEVEGNRITERFVDNRGEKHIVEYDEVFSFGLNPYEDSHTVEIKILPRKFDGFKWGSKEFKETSFPPYLFTEMFQAIGKGEDLETSKIVNVPGSCHIKCVDSNYQAMFHYLAAMHSPIIFNNTCWSWSDVADSFLGLGARGYIGTLWDINNDVAKQSAEIFYNNIFEATVLNALQKSLMASDTTKDENIYIFWGLHFITITAGISLPTSRKVVLSKMMNSMQMWKQKLEKTQIIKHRKRITSIIDWLARTQVRDFKKEIIEYMNKN